MLNLISLIIGLVALAPRYGINGAAVVTSVAWVSQVLFLIVRGALRSSPGGLGVPVEPEIGTPLLSSDP